MFVQGKMREQVQRLPLNYGFGFDVVTLQHDGTVQLVEVISFGRSEWMRGLRV